MTEFWTHVAVAAVIIGATAIAAKLIDRRIDRLELAPGAATRYRVLRRSIVVTIVCIGILSALLVIPQVRAVAGAILASGAVLGLVLGFAAQRTIGNFIAGLLLAFTQPIRLGDEVEVEGTRGIVEEIGLTYTWVRTRRNDRLVIPNERLVSLPLHNATIRSRSTIAEVSVRVPLTAELQPIVSALQQDASDVYVTDLDGGATIAVRRRVPDEHAVDREASDLRLLVHERLRALGVFEPTAA
jgi:small-conductance mechanosensitive channel